MKTLMDKTYEDIILNGHSDIALKLLKREDFTEAEAYSYIEAIKAGIMRTI